MAEVLHTYLLLRCYNTFVNELSVYLFSRDFTNYLTGTGTWWILGMMAVAFVALWLEIRLPLKYYWNLPWHALHSLLAVLHIVKPQPVWGRCYEQDSRQGLTLVACDLLDPSSHKLLHRTYSNHQGEYGFALRPGKYLLKAVKDRYRMPSLLDPENVEVYEVDEAFVASVTVLNREIAPAVDLPLVPVKKAAERTVADRFWHYGRMFLFQLGNVLLGLVIVLALLGWANTQDPYFGLIIAVSLILLFIKLYLLETIRVVTVKS